MRSQGRSNRKNEEEEERQQESHHQYRSRRSDRSDRSNTYGGKDYYVRGRSRDRNSRSQSMNYNPDQNHSNSSHRHPHPKRDSIRRSPPLRSKKVLNEERIVGRGYGEKSSHCSSNTRYQQNDRKVGHSKKESKREWRNSGLGNSVQRRSNSPILKSPPKMLKRIERYHHQTTSSSKNNPNLSVPIKGEQETIKKIENSSVANRPIDSSTQHFNFTDDNSAFFKFHKNQKNEENACTTVDENVKIDNKETIIPTATINRTRDADGEHKISSMKRVSTDDKLRCNFVESRNKKGAIKQIERHENFPRMNDDDSSSSNIIPSERKSDNQPPHIDTRRKAQETANCSLNLVDSEVSIIKTGIDGTDAVNKKADDSTISMKPHVLMKGKLNNLNGNKTKPSSSSELSVPKYLCSDLNTDQSVSEFSGTTKDEVDTLNNPCIQNESTEDVFVSGIESETKKHDTGIGRNALNLGEKEQSKSIVKLEDKVNVNKSQFLDSSSLEKQNGLCDGNSICKRTNIGMSPTMEVDVTLESKETTIVSQVSMQLELNEIHKSSSKGSAENNPCTTNKIDLSPSKNAKVLEGTDNLDLRLKNECGSLNNESDESILTNGGKKGFEKENVLSSSSSNGHMKTRDEQSANEKKSRSSKLKKKSSKIIVEGDKNNSKKRMAKLKTKANTDCVEQEETVKRNRRINKSKQVDNCSLKGLKKTFNDKMGDCNKDKVSIKRSEVDQSHMQVKNNAVEKPESLNDEQRQRLIELLNSSSDDENKVEPKKEELNEQALKDLMFDLGSSSDDEKKEVAAEKEKLSDKDKNRDKNLESMKKLKREKRKRVDNVAKLAKKIRLDERVDEAEKIGKVKKKKAEQSSKVDIKDDSKMNRMKRSLSRDGRDSVATKTKISGKEWVSQESLPPIPKKQRNLPTSSTLESDMRQSNKIVNSVGSIKQPVRSVKSIKKKEAFSLINVNSLGSQMIEKRKKEFIEEKAFQKKEKKLKKQMKLGIPLNKDDDIISNDSGYAGYGYPIKFDSKKISVDMQLGNLTDKACRSRNSSAEEFTCNFIQLATHCRSFLNAVNHVAGMSNTKAPASSTVSPILLKETEEKDKYLSLPQSYGINRNKSYTCTNSKLTSEDHLEPHFAGSFPLGVDFGAYQNFQLYFYDDIKFVPGRYLGKTTVFVSRIRYTNGKRSAVSFNDQQKKNEFQRVLAQRFSLDRAAVNNHDHTSVTNHNARHTPICFIPAKSWSLMKEGKYACLFLDYKNRIDAHDAIQSFKDDGGQSLILKSNIGGPKNYNRVVNNRAPVQRHPPLPPHCSNNYRGNPHYDNKTDWGNSNSRDYSSYNCSNNRYSEQPSAQHYNQHSYSNRDPYNSYPYSDGQRRGGNRYY